MDCENLTFLGKRFDRKHVIEQKVVTIINTKRNRHIRSNIKVTLDDKTFRSSVCKHLSPLLNLLVYSDGL